MSRLLPDDSSRSRWALGTASTVLHQERTSVTSRQQGPRWVDVAEKVDLFSDRGDFRGEIFCWPNRAGSALAGPVYPKPRKKKQTSATNLAGDHGDQPGQQDRG
jgi:hypothetical protein